MSTDPDRDHETGEDPSGERSSPRFEISSSSGVQVGSGNVQHNYFYARQTWSDRRTRPPRGDSPYRGLNAFETEDSDYFFGRDDAIGKVLERLARCLDGPAPLAISGVSGAGKSSLLRAGVLPRLREDGLAGAEDAASWPCLLLTPGQSPLGELATRVASLSRVDAALVQRQLADNPGGFALTARQAALSRQEDAAGHRGGRLILIIDQFEQLFTVCPDEAQRRAFVEALHAAATIPQGPEQVPAALVVLAVRADFESRCARYPQLTAAIQERYLLTGMTSRQLRLAVTGPAAKAGSRVAPELAETLIREISTRQSADGGDSAGEVTGPGVLPLLSHALDQAWRNRDGNALTLADYERTGGIETAVAQSAQDTYDRLAADQRDMARRVFTALAATTPDGSDTAVPVPVPDLEDKVRGDPRAVIRAFAGRRLLTLNTDTVEITHEVLLAAWPLLRDNWLAENRADRIVRTGLRAAAAEWARHDRDPAYLYRGNRLETAAAAEARSRKDPSRFPALTSSERDFLTAGHQQDRRRRRRGRAVLAGLTTLVVALGVTAGVAFAQRNAAVSERQRAASQALAAQSQATGDADPVLARLEAVAAWSINHGNSHAEYSMLSAAFLPWTRSFSDSADAPANSVSFDPKSSILAVGTDSGVQLWNPQGGQLTRTLPIGNHYTADSVVFSADGKFLAVGMGTHNYIGYGQVQIWNTESWKPVAVRVGNSDDSVSVDSLAFSENDSRLAIGLDDGNIKVWNVGGNELADSLSTGRDNSVLSVAFSPGNGMLAAGTDDGMRAWNPATWQPVSFPGGGGGSVSAVAFSPAGSIMAARTGDGVQLRGAGSRKLTAVLPAKADGSSPGSLAFNHDGTMVAAGTVGGMVKVWSTRTRGQVAAISSGKNAVNSVAFNDGDMLAAGTSGDARIANVAADSSVSTPYSTFPVLDADPPGVGGVNSIAFSPGGDFLAVAANKNEGFGYGSVIPSGEIWIWDSVKRRISSEFSIGPNLANAVAFSRNGRLLAVGTENGTQLWAAAARKRVAQLSGADCHYSSGVDSVAFSATGALLAVGCELGNVQLWDPTTRKKVMDIPASQDRGVDSVGFSPDGRLLAVGMADGTVRLWDVGRRRWAGVFRAGNSNGVDSVTFSPAGSLLAAGTVNDTVQVWDTATRQRAMAAVSGISPAFSPDGRVLAVEGKSGVGLWDPGTAQQIGLLPATADTHVGTARGTSLAFTPDSAGLAVAGTRSGAGDQVRLWKTPYLQNPVSYLCHLVGQPFPRDKWAQYAPGLPYQRTCP